MRWLTEHREHLTGAVIVVLAVLAGFVLRRLVRRRLRGWAERTDTRFDDALTASLDRPIPWWMVLAGAYIAARIAPLEAAARALFDKVLLTVLIVSVTWWIGDVAVRLLVAFATSRDEPAPAAATGITRHLLRLSIYTVGALVLLGTLGVSITPLLTTLGVGGVAVALGLQNTLSSFFAGIHITLARNLRVGDFVKLETGEQGHVEDIGWRATRVRVLAHNLVIIPNGRLADSIVTNYDLPSRELAVLVQLGVHYASNLAKVERVTCQVAREVMKEVPGAVPEFEPFVRFHTFGASSIDFTIILRAARFTDHFLIKHELIKRLLQRYEAEGIVIPFPIQALNLDQESAAEALRRH